jgi:hypothetical protein
MDLNVCDWQWELAEFSLLYNRRWYVDVFGTKKNKTCWYQQVLFFSSGATRK